MRTAAYRYFAIAWCCFCAQSALAQTIEGFTEPYRDVDLVPVEPGVLVKLLVAEGDQVRKGDLLGSLDCEMQELALETAQANLAAQGRLEGVRAERELRKERLRKLEQLLATGHATQEEVSQARAEFLVADGNLTMAIEQRRLDEIEVRRIETTIERRKIRSPFDGVISQIYRDEHELVGGTSHPVLKVVQVDKLKAVFPVPSGRAMELRPGQRVDVLLPEHDEPVQGEILYLCPVIDAESDTVRVKVLLENARGQFQAGVRCTLLLRETSGPSGASPAEAQPAPIGVTELGETGFAR